MREPPQFDGHPIGFDEAGAAGVHRAVMIGGKWAVDGDTVYAWIDYGWWDYGWKSVRFAGIDAPEIHHAEDEEELEAGRAARDYLRTKVFSDPSLSGESHALVRSAKDTSLGRIVSEVLVPAADAPFVPEAGMEMIGGVQWVSVGQVLVDEGHAELSDG